MTSARRVRGKTTAVGLHHGTAGQVVALNGRVLYEGVLRPHGAIALAKQDAVAYASYHHYEIIGK